MLFPTRGISGILWNTGVLYIEILKDRIFVENFPLCRLEQGKESHKISFPTFHRKETSYETSLNFCVHALPLPPLARSLAKQTASPNTKRKAQPAADA
jgi:hypothetical protein